jgi:hypothetical protein
MSTRARRGSVLGRRLAPSRCFILDRQRLCKCPGCVTLPLLSFPDHARVAFGVVSALMMSVQNVSIQDRG